MFALIFDCNPENICPVLNCVFLTENSVTRLKRTGKLYVDIIGILTKLFLQYLKQTNKKNLTSIPRYPAECAAIFHGQFARTVQILSGLLKRLQVLSHVHRAAAGSQERLLREEY